MTESAQAAKMIRKELKEKFPTIKFRVRSENYAGGDAVNIYYQNGVPQEKVEEITKKYQYGSFNGMIDMYENTNRRDFPQAKFVFTNRELTEEVKEELKIYLMKYWQLEEWSDTEIMKKMNMWSDQLIWKEARERTFA